MDVNELLHHQRSAHLAQMPPNASVLLSAGCSGGWYFDWIEQYYGRVDSHIGLEFYMPRPDDLPSNVTWIENTVGDMRDVESGSVDLLFSGQNIEHLWLDDMVSCLTEANRVLRPGGHLVMDSPNRTQTERLQWTQPEHTVELTVDEALTAFQLAGFEVTKSVGLWLIAAASPTFEPADDSDTVVRTLLATDRPDQSFVWWIEGERVREADAVSLRTHLRDVFERAWPERLQRFIPLDANVLPGSNDLANNLGAPGIVMFGPYTPLPAGDYTVSFDITGLQPMVESPGAVDVMVDGEVVERVTIPPVSPDSTVHPTMDFSLSEPMNFGVQFRVESNGTSQFRTRRHVELVDHSEASRGPAYDRSPDGTKEQNGKR